MISPFRRLLLVLFNIAKFFATSPSSRGELFAYAARELSTAYRCPSSCAKPSVVEHWDFFCSLFFSVRSTWIGVAVLCCRRRQTHGLALTRRGGGRMVD